MSRMWLLEMADPTNRGLRQPDDLCERVARIAYIPTKAVGTYAPPSALRMCLCTIRSQDADTEGNAGVPTSPTVVLLGWRRASGRVGKGARSRALPGGRPPAVRRTR